MSRDGSYGISTGGEGPRCSDGLPGPAHHEYGGEGGEGGGKVHCPVAVRLDSNSLQVIRDPLLARANVVTFDVLSWYAMAAYCSMARLVSTTPPLAIAKLSHKPDASYRLFPINAGEGGADAGGRGGGGDARPKNV